MLIRGVLLATLVVTAAPAVPVRAAASPYVFYEAVRMKAGGASQIPFRVYVTGGGIVTQLEVEPADEGGFHTTELRISESSGGGEASFLWLVRPKPGHRYFIGGPRGHIRVLRMSLWFSYKPASLGLRTVTPAQSDEDHHQVATEDVTVFRSATAPGGKYGSVAIAWVPCDNGVGRWSFGTDKEPGTPETCTTGGAVERETYRGRTWTLSGTVVGESRWKYRLLVLDFPKR